MAATVAEVGLKMEELLHKATDYLDAMSAQLSDLPANDTFVWPLGGVVAYLTTVFLLHRWMRDKPVGTFDAALRWPLVIHNYILCIFSLALVVGITYRVSLIYTQCSGGIYATYCGCYEAPELSRGLTFWAYLFYLSKYYELFDTVFLVLRKRPLTFLHVYHHAIVMPMCWFAINQGTPSLPPPSTPTPDPHFPSFPPILIWSDSYRSRKGQIAQIMDRNHKRPKSPAAAPPSRPEGSALFSLHCADDSTLSFTENVGPAIERFITFD
jgi:hypothetical protein